MKRTNLAKKRRKAWSVDKEIKEKGRRIGRSKPQTKGWSTKAEEEIERVRSVWSMNVWPKGGTRHDDKRKKERVRSTAK